MRIMACHPPYIPVPKEEKLEIQKRVEDLHKQFIIGDNFELLPNGQVRINTEPTRPSVPIEEQALAMMTEEEIVSSIGRLAELFSQAVVDLDFALTGDSDEITQSA